ncbi:MAG TPA: hypothetical protein VEC56_05440 [Candidatus Krumholzibacteria bacterium]|nr:hypothetical protein [Candidatus Krumholzibacteria bacterium]
MIVTAIKIVLLIAFVILIALAIGLVVMAGVAQSHDVVRIPVPQSTFVAGTEPKSIYSDAYVAPMEYSTFRDIDRVAQLAFHRGTKEVHRDEREVAYEGTMLGLSYTISYILMKDSSPQTLTVATTVRIVEPKKGKYCWMVAKHVHRHLLPYLLDRMVITAPD